MLGDPAVLRVVECPLEVVETRCDDDPPAQALVVNAADRRQALQDEGHLRHHAGRADVLDPPAQSRADLGRVDEAQKGLLGVGVRYDDPRVDLLSARQSDPVDRASTGSDGRDVGVAANRRAVALRRGDERLHQGIRPAAREDRAAHRSSS